MNKPSRSSKRRRDSAAPSAVLDADQPENAQRGARQDVAFAAAREVKERVQAKAGKASSRGPRRALADDPPLDVTKLSGIEVHVRALREVSEADVDARLVELLRARADAVEIEPGGALALHDDVLLDTIGYVNGAPLTAHVDTWMRLSPNPLLPGLFEQIADAKLGEPLVVRIVLPADYPQADRAGKAAAFVVRTKAARRMTPAPMDDERALLSLGRGATTSAVRAHVYEELLRERATELVEEAKQRFLDEVERRLPLDVDERQMEAELARRWRLEEGDALARQGASSEEQAAARAGFLAHEGRRRDVRRALFADRLLEGVAAERGVVVSFDDVVRLVVQAASGSSLPVSDLHTALTADVALLAELADKLRKTRSLSWLLEKATVSFDV